MKQMLFILLTTLATGIQAKSYLQNTYIVVSDQPSKDVPQGTCRVKGNVFNGGGVLQNALISNIDRSRSAVTNEEGKYEFLLSALDSSIFFFKEGFSEQVIWSYPFKAGHEVHIDFYAGYENMMLEVDKPVIYLYSLEEITATVNPDFKGDLTFTYPTLNDAWEVKLSDNQIYDLASKKNYPYLFWEGLMADLDFITNEDLLFGKELHSSEIVIYLEQSLTDMGFNQTEKSDFITFWGPKLASKPYSFIQFLQNEQVDEELGGLKVEPQPDTQKRVFMLFKTFDEAPNYNCIPQQFESFDRTGFTLLEWGGTEVHSTKLKL